LLIHEVELVEGKFQKVEGTDQELPADLVFLALGFVGPEHGSWLDQLGVDFDARGNVERDDNYMSNVPGVFVAGDMGRGQSLIVWAIAEGRACAAGVDSWLMGVTDLPAPIPPTARPLV
jgi:glutamate synthase (NADPH/NADH) small chain